MSIRVAINHRTEFGPDRGLERQAPIFRLQPAAHNAARLISHRVKVFADGHVLHRQLDAYGNHLLRIVLPEQTRHLLIEVDLVVELAPAEPVDFYLEPAALYWPFAYDQRATKDLQLYLETTENGPALQQWLLATDRGSHPTLEFLAEQNRRVHQSIDYLAAAGWGGQSCDETLTLGSGSCSDLAWLLLQVLRHLGVAARFVSGYLLRPEAEAELATPVLAAGESITLHAWVEAFVPGSGWIGFDPATGRTTGAWHIALACAPDPEAAAPFSEIAGLATPETRLRAEVQGVHVPLTLAQLYSESQWQRIQEFGERVHAELASEGGLYLRGVARFVPTGSEQSLRTQPRDKAAIPGFLYRLRQAHVDGGLIQLTQDDSSWRGSIYARSDGESLWREAELLANPRAAADWQLADAGRFMRAFATILGLDMHAAIPGFVSRDTSAVAIGYALPLQRSADGHWYTSLWRFPGDRMVLAEGAAAMGWRLPTDLILAEAHGTANVALPLPDSAGSDLPSHAALRSRFPKAAASGTDSGAGIRTALCAEIRAGRLWVFLPAADDLPAFLELVTAIELVVAAVGIPVLLEGHAPPADPRLQTIDATTDADGGIVLQASRHKTSQESMAFTQEVYAAAAACGLAAGGYLPGGEVIVLDQAPITLHAITAQRNPFLRRPDLLQSILRYWQCHPSLSYLFAGQRIGAKGPAPRLDELDPDNLYELKVALEQMPDGSESDRGLVGRWLEAVSMWVGGDQRHSELELVSAAGRGQAEQCLVLHGFAMPPHPRMQVVQYALLASLFSWFWRKPYSGPLSRWGAALHDRYYLPYVLWQDFKQVIGDLQEAGYAVDVGWFEVFKEYRFPLLGRIEFAAGTLELRSALETWREPLPADRVATATEAPGLRTERVQVLTRGLNEAQHLVLCNGRQVPLQHAAEAGVAVAGVRYYAATGPSRESDAQAGDGSLRFTVVDRIRGRIAGTCSYQVHAEATNFDSQPLDHNEARARRALRFNGVATEAALPSIPALTVDSDYPCTLDLRYRPAGSRDSDGLA